jgi:hypothetical protein
MVGDRFDRTTMKVELVKSKKALIETGVPESHIIYFIRNGKPKKKGDKLNTLGVWMYNLNDALDFLNQHTKDDIIGPKQKTTYDAVALDGTDFDLLRDCEMCGIVEDKPDQWNEHVVKMIGILESES